MNPHDRTSELLHRLHQLVKYTDHYAREMDDVIRNLNRIVARERTSERPSDTETDTDET